MGFDDLEKNDEPKMAPMGPNPLAQRGAQTRLRWVEIFSPVGAFYESNQKQ